MDPGAPELRRGGRAAGRPKAGVQLRYERGRRRPGPGAAGPAAAADRGARGGGRVLRRAARHAPAPRPAREFLAQRGFDQARAETLRLRVRPGRLGPADQAPAPAGLHAAELVTGRAGQGGALGQPDRPVPAPADVADPGPDRRHHRLRRAQAVRRRRRPEVPEHPRDAALQEVARALRHRPGQAGDRQAGPGGHRRGLHRRDGLPPGRRADRRGDLRHRVRRRPHRRAAPAADGHRRATPARSSSPSTATRPGRRRRCGRSRTTSGSSRRPSSRSARTTWTRASCGWPRATWPSATWSPGGSR